MTRRTFVAGAMTAGAALGGTRPSRSPATRAQGAQEPAEAATAVITDVTIIDATGAPPLPQMTVVIEGERIADIRPAAAAGNLGAARVIDGAGRFLIPGLWDAHVHTFVFPWQPDLYLPLLIANGVTGVRDMGGAFPFPVIDEVRAAIASGERIGPRIVAGMMVDGPRPVWPFALRAATAEEGREAVDAVAEAGADFVKVYTLLPREAFVAIAEAAQERALPFAGHVPASVTATEASDAGQRSIEHFDQILPSLSLEADAIFETLRAAASGLEPAQAYLAAFWEAMPRILETIDPETVAALAARFAANQTWFTPTLVTGQSVALSSDPALTGDPRLRYMPPEVVASWSPETDYRTAEGPSDLAAIARQAVKEGAAIAAMMRRAGVAVLAGTDLGLPYLFPGFSLHDELALLVGAGLTPLEALQAATRDPARCAGLGEELGTVETGKLADLVLLEADPLADIANTTRIAVVIANGRVFEQAELQGLLRAAERAATAPVASPAP